MAKEKLTLIYQKMKDERFNGEIIINGFWIIWKFSENIRACSHKSVANLEEIC